MCGKEREEERKIVQVHTYMNRPLCAYTFVSMYINGKGEWRRWWIFGGVETKDCTKGKKNVMWRRSGEGDGR